MSDRYFNMLSNFRFTRCYGAFLGNVPVTVLSCRTDLQYHHSALAPGYCKRPKRFVCGSPCWPTYQYNGRFGSGYVQILHNPDSTEYVIVMYYIRG